MTEFADNNGVSVFTSVSPFYANKGFHPRMNFSPDIIDYVIIRKRLNTTKVKDIIDHIQNVLVYIRENLNRAQLIIIEQINRHKQDVTFKEDDLVFFNSKNIIIDRSCKKLNDKMFDSFLVKAVVGFFYKLKLSKIMKIYNVFHFKLLNLVVINSLFGQKNSFFTIIIVKDKEK